MESQVRIGETDVLDRTVVTVVRIVKEVVKERFGVRVFVTVSDSVLIVVTDLYGVFVGITKIMSVKPPGPIGSITDVPHLGPSDTVTIVSGRRSDIPPVM